MVTGPERQAIVDEEHLRLLPVFYWVLGAMDILFALYGLIYVAYGVFFMMIPSMAKDSASSQAFPGFIGWFMIAFGLAFMLAFGVTAALKILTGFWIKGRRRRTACLVMAGVSCLMLPFGTVVGVFTFLVLLRPSVAALFDPPGHTDALAVDQTREHAAGDTGDQDPSEPERDRPAVFRSLPRRRVLKVAAAVLAALLVISATLGMAGALAWRAVWAQLRVWDGSAFSGPALSTEELTRFAADYPDYRVVEWLPRGFILQHRSIRPLRIDVRFFPHGGTAPWWAGSTVETVTAEWDTTDTFFRHGAGQSPDPRTGMNYDVEGFAKEYASLIPGPNSVVACAELVDVDSDGFETYVVAVERRDPGDGTVPDYSAGFSRYTDTGEWEGDRFQPLFDEEASD